MFEKFADEKKFFNSIKNLISSTFEIRDVALENGSDIYAYLNPVKSRDSKFRVNITEDNVFKVMSFYLGDLVEACFTIGGIPPRYYWDAKLDMRLRRTDVMDHLKKAFYICMVDLVKEANVSK
jgi:hypothetical protein